MVVCVVVNHWCYKMGSASGLCGIFCELQVLYCILPELRHTGSQRFTYFEEFQCRSAVSYSDIGVTAVDSGHVFSAV
jgi:hypothetical protein